MDRARVEALFLEHAAGLKRFCWGVLKNEALADEAVQQTFVKVIEKGHTADADKQKAWIYKVAFHQALEIRRRGKTADRAMDKLANRPGPDAPPPPANVAADRETVQRARRAIEALPTEQKKVFMMRVQDGKTFAQIAEALDIPLGTALTRMRLATKKLREQVEETP